MEELRKENDSLRSVIKMYKVRTVLCKVPILHNYVQCRRFFLISGIVRGKEIQLEQITITKTLIFLDVTKNQIQLHVYNCFQSAKKINFTACPLQLARKLFLLARKK